eukprot:evm.model.scf_496.2 EVM.evm.TU.scf_496.2   scf_496:3424-5583(+)
MDRAERGAASLTPLARSAALCALLILARGQSPAGEDSSPVPAGDHLVRLLPAIDLENDTDIQRLRRGEPIVDTLGSGGQRVLRFGVTKVDAGGFPDVSLWLRPSGEGGNAALFCAPWAAAASEGARLSRGEYPWVSADGHGLDAVFMSSESDAYRSAVTTVNASRGDGGEGTFEAAAFLCVIEDTSPQGGQFSLELGLTVGGLDLVEEQRDAVRGIYDRCCPSRTACAAWPDAPEDAGEDVATDLCDVAGNICDSGGRLLVMSLEGYNLSCHFPFQEVGALWSLEKLRAGGNLLSGKAEEIFAGLAALENLTHVDLASTRLHGSLTGAQGVCEMATKGLQVLRLQDNLIGGGLPACLLAAGSSLLDIDLCRNDMTGSLPDVVPVGSPLEAIAMSENNMDGKIPASLLENGRMLSRLNLTGNALTGSVPESLGGLPFLTTFAAGGNKLTTLPMRWSDEGGQIFQALSMFDLSGNLLEGQFPAALGRADNLAALDLSDNRLDGPLPNETGLFPSLNFLNISSNAFGGPVHESWSDLGIFSLRFTAPEIGVLDARNNNLTGDFPQFFFTDSESYMETRKVYVAGNNFTCPLGGVSGSIVVDVCGGNMAAQAEALDETLDNSVTPEEVEHEEEFADLLRNSTNAVMNSTLAGKMGDGSSMADASSGGSGANLVGAIVIVLVTGVLFGAIMAFIWYWRRKRNEPRDRLVRHLKFRDDVELQGFQ